MANQITIDIGAAANDGTGDPLRTAFNYVNNNFSNVWNTGLPNSNVQFSDNRILTVNTNANLVLSPNGIAKVISNVSILPNMANVHDLGSSTNRWNTVYAQYLNISSDVAFGNLTVDGNLTVTGNIIEIGNIITDAKTIQLANTANTANAANGSGVTVGASDNIATLLYNSTSNTWTTNIGVSVTGNVTGNYILGNGAFLTGLSTYGNANVAAYLPTYTGNLSAGNAAITNLTSSNLVNGRTGTFTGDQYSDGAMYVGSPAGTVLGSDVVIQITANSGSYSQTNFQNINPGVTSSSDYILTADNGNNTTHYLDLGITSSGWNGSETNVLANLVANNGYLYVQDGNLTVGTRNGNVSYGWNFDTTGNLTVPKDIIPTANNIQNLGSATRQWNDLYLSNATIYMNSVPISLTAGNVLTVNGADVVTTAANGESNIGNLDILGTTVSITAGAPETYINLSASVQGFAYVQVPNDATANISNVRIHNDAGNIEFGTGNYSTGETNYTWNFNRNGGTIYPTLTVTRGDRTGTLTGQTLLFGDATQEALISTPDGNDTDGTSSQRLVINPGKGADGSTGEGGDIYLYAGRGGDAGGSGGDIKIRGGLGPVNGAGGYITMEGGEADVNGVGGYIEIYGGVSGNSTGGLLDLRGGLGQTEGGGIFIQGGQGQSGPGGPVNITGGVSGLGLAEYGNVGVIAGASSWVFDNTGNLTLPNDGVVYETNIPFGGLSGKTIALKPYGGTDADQQLLVYPTAGADFNHLHLTSGNLWNTEMFLGNDDFYVKLANTGNIVINTNDNTGNTAQWTFGTEGTILNSGNLTIQTPSGIPSSLSNWQGGGGWNQGFYGNLATTGGTGTGLTVDVAAGGAGYISINEITINTPGTGYTNGDVITIDNENNIPGTFTVSVTSNGWTFDNTGVLTLPGEGILQSIDDTVTLTSFNTSTGNANSVYMGSAGGLGFFDQAIGGNWLEIFRSGAEPEIRVPVGRGNLNIQTAQGENSYNWTFDNTGVLTVPGNIVMPPGSSLVSTGASPAPNISGFSSASFGADVTASGNITGGNLRALTNLYVEAANGNLVLGDASATASPGLSSTNSITVTANRAGTPKEWVFTTDGGFVGSGNISGGNLTVTGNITGNTAGYAIGYRDIPQVSFAGDTTIATTDAGKHYYSVLSTGNVLTIANNASQGFQVGAAITVVNQGSGTITIAQGSGVTLYMAGNATASNRSISTFGMATIMKVATNTWFINGTGVS